MYNLSFSTKEEYKDFLIRQMNKISETGDFNVFLHCVTTHTPYISNKGEEKEKQTKFKISNIWKTGLDLNGAIELGNYGSINCTAKFLGSANDVDIEKIINYDFFSQTSKVYTFIFAIPKWIEIEDVVYEFSSYNGEMKSCYQHEKTCLLDVVKGAYLPTDFILACQEIDRSSGTVDVSINDRQFSYLEQKEQDKVMSPYEEKLSKIIFNYNQKYGFVDLKQIFRDKTEEHLRNINDFLMDP